MPLKIFYWDACVFHALFKQEDGRMETCLRIQEAARNGSVHIYTSAVTLIECLWIKGQLEPSGRPDKLLPEHEEKIQRYFMQPFIKIINCDRRIAESARALIWQNPHLKWKDAVHVATALSQPIDLLHSYDNNDIVSLNGKIGSPPLKICNPGDGDGFESSGGLFPRIISN